MKLRDPQLLARLMEDADDGQGISQRELAIAAGWRSHTYVARLIKGDATNLKPQPAARIAKRLRVPIDLLFVTKLSSDTVQPAKRKRAA
jgi:transcriptional regulator with XRE-family HTH domain